MAICIVSTSGKSLATSTARDSWSDLARQGGDDGNGFDWDGQPAGECEQLHHGCDLLTSKGLSTFLPLLCTRHRSQKPERTTLRYEHPLEKRDLV